MKHILYCFDIDGVLTDTGYNIDPKFKEWFIEWSIDKNYVLVTGSTYERTIEQIGEEITNNAMLVANCMGNSITQEGRTVTVNEFEFTTEERAFLQKKLDNSLYDERYGQHFANRPGSVNFSIAGRNANNEQRERYKDYDSHAQERLALAVEFKEKFPRFDVYIGGDISIDICLRGANKSQILDLTCNYWPECDILFYGDKMGEWGIDTPLATEINNRNIGGSYEVLGGYQETKKMIQ